MFWIGGSTHVQEKWECENNVGKLARMEVGKSFLSGSSLLLH